MQRDPESSEGPTQPNNNNVNNNNNVLYLNEEDLTGDHFRVNLDVESDSDFQPDQSLLGNALDSNNDESDVRSGRVKRGATVAYAAYTCFVISFFVAALTKDSGKQCDKPLHAYATVEIITQALSFVLYICVHHFNGCDPAAQPNQAVLVTRFSLSNWIQFMRRVLNMFWMFWLVMASFWTFSADTCSDTAPLLYTFSLVIVLIHLVFFGLVLVCCWCALLVFAIIYRLHPEIFTQQNPTVAGASDKAINALETKKYVVGMMEAEDAKCAICLAAYEPGEDIRFLPCDSKKHHFHNQCIDEWLRISGSCPYCKHGIEEKAKNNNNDENNASNGNSDENV